MAIERSYNVPLRREFMKAPKYRRAKLAINTLKRFLQKHMKSEELFIGKRLNEKIWERGIKNPPHHVNVTVIKEDDGKVYAELSGFKYEKSLTEEEIKKLEKERKKAAKAEEKKPAEIKQGEAQIKDEIKKLEEKTEKIKEEKAKKGAEQEQQIEQLPKKTEKPAKDTSEPKDKKPAEHPSNA